MHPEPRGAALFALACAMTAFNVLAVLKAELRAAHALDTIVDSEDWSAFRVASTAAMAAWLRMQA